jgi:hypothetical protein
VLARDHPYDPFALLAAGEARAAAGDVAGAVAVLERAVWLRDLDPASAGRAADRLRALAPAWRERRVVPVYLLADESVRADPAFAFRLRLLLLWASRTLDPLLGAFFAPAGVVGFDASQAPATLDAIQAAALAGVAPNDGMLAVFTERLPPRQPRGVLQLGQAEFLGRALCVRLAAGERTSRVLVHELLHLYGGIHVAEDIDSLMNPSGSTEVQLDPMNARIVRSLRERTFGPGGIERNVFPRIDVHETAEAYLAALRVNLTFRRLGVLAGAGPDSRRAARRRARQWKALDPHLADVASFTAMLLVRDQRPADAVDLLEVAAALYGPRSPRGRAMRELEGVIERSYPIGEPAPGR